MHGESILDYQARNHERVSKFVRPSKHWVCYRPAFPREIYFLFKLAIILGATQLKPLNGSIRFKCKSHIFLRVVFTFRVFKSDCFQFWKVTEGNWFL